MTTFSLLIVFFAIGLSILTVLSLILTAIVALVVWYYAIASS